MFVVGWSALREVFLTGRVGGGAKMSAQSRGDFTFLESALQILLQTFILCKIIYFSKKKHGQILLTVD